MKKVLFLVISFMSAITSFAQTDILDGNYIYELTNFAGKPTREAIITGLNPEFTPSGVLELPNTMFYEGKNYPVVMLGKGNYTEYAMTPPVFFGFTGITAVKIPVNMRYIANNEFADCPNIEGYEVAEGNTAYKTIDGSLLEHYYDDEWQFFRYPSAAKAKTFCIPASLRYIDSWAFAANNHLKVIQIVGDQSLSNGWQLGNRCIEAIDASNHVRNYVMEDGALYWGKSLEAYCPGNKKDSFTPREGTTQIENGAFCEAPIGTLIIPASVTAIGSVETFHNSDISNLELPEGMTINTVGKMEFMNCRNLKFIPLGCNEKGNLHIGEFGFAGCDALEGVTLAEGTKTIDIWYRAFYNCRKLASFPAAGKMRITDIGRYAFAECESLTSFPFACLQEIETSGGYQFAGSGLTQVNWPSVLSMVPQGCFKDCRNLKKINLKMTTTQIGNEAFAGSGITAISLMGVTNYAYNAFANCQDLYRLYFPKTDKDSPVTYWPINFQPDNGQIIVNNANIYGLDRQKTDHPASLYISMVAGGVTIGDGWNVVWVPGRASELYRNITAAPVTEMYSYETFPEDAAVAIDHLAPGIKVTSVVIEGVEATLDNGRYVAQGVTIDSDKMNVTVNYTVFGNPMTSKYEWVYDSLPEIISGSDSTNEKWYDLTGKPVSSQSPAPGIYIRIINGRSNKVMIR